MKRGGTVDLDDQLSEDEKLVRDSAQAFAQRYLAPRAAQVEEQFNREIMIEMGRAGLLGAVLTLKYCGAGLSHCLRAAAREVERIDSGYRSLMSVQSSLVIQAIVAYGSDARRRRYLPNLATGEWIGCFGLTEPDAGSDPQAMRTKAEAAYRHQDLDHKQPGRRHLHCLGKIERGQIIAFLQL